MDGHISGGMKTGIRWELETSFVSKRTCYCNKFRLRLLCTPDHYTISLGACLALSLPGWLARSIILLIYQPQNNKNLEYNTRPFAELKTIGTKWIHRQPDILTLLHLCP